MCIVIGKVNSHDQNTMIGLVALMAIFLEAGNGANFSLVPHVHPHANGKSSLAPDSLLAKMLIYPKVSSPALSAL
jgi:hypothetical protein